MKTRILYHPWWTHLPAAALVAAMVVAVVQAVPLPASAGVHFGFNGQPDRYGSPWGVVAFVLGYSVFFLALSVFLDELWARQERRKTFNWMSWFDEAMVGFMAGMLTAYLASLRGGPALVMPWGAVAGTVLFAVLAAVLLEYRRSYVPGPVPAPSGEDTEGLALAVRENMAAGRQWAFVDVQAPWWSDLVVVLVSVLQMVAAVMVWPASPWLSLLMLAIGLAIWLLYGGLRMVVLPDRVEVRLGLLGLRLLRIRAGEIAAVEVYSFSPLRDFGGYGIRINREMTAYFFRGNVGVKVRTANGKQYLLGSDHPERLAAVIMAVSDPSSAGTP
jgi:hypothetical protein